MKKSEKSNATPLCVLNFTSNHPSFLVTSPMPPYLVSQPPPPPPSTHTFSPLATCEVCVSIHLLRGPPSPSIGGIKKWVFGNLFAHLFKVGVHLKAVFTSLKIGQMEISCSHFTQDKNPPFITQVNDLGCFMNFWVIFR